jgi:hypothetical protein
MPFVFQSVAAVEEKVGEKFLPKKPTITEFV